MWLSPKVFSILQVSKDSVDALRAEVTTLRAERDLLRTQLQVATSNFDWLRLRVNTLEVERAQLIEKTYGLKPVVPEIVRTARSPLELTSDIFNDVGDDQARQLGLATLSAESV